MEVGLGIAFATGFVFVSLRSKNVKAVRRTTRAGAATITGDVTGAFTFETCVA